MREMIYFKPKSFREALELKNRYGSKSCVVAGCTNLIPNIRANIAKAAYLIDLINIKGLDQIRNNGKKVKIGARVTVADILNFNSQKGKISQEDPIYPLQVVAKGFANPLIRNRATVAGNLANASPAADMAIPLLIMNARIFLASITSGKERIRSVPLAQFFIKRGKTCINSSEIIKEIEFEGPPDHALSQYLKLGKRQGTAISIISMAMMMVIQKTLSNTYQCADVRIAFGAVSPIPMRGFAAESFLLGKYLDDDVIEKAGQIVSEIVHPISDIRASSSYRKEMAKELTGRLIRKCLSEKMANEIE